MGLESRCKTWAWYVIYLFILYFFSTFLFAAKLHVWELTMARLPPYTRTPASTVAYDDPQTSHRSPQHHSSSRSADLEPWVCLFVFFFFFLMRMVAQILGPDNNRCMFSFFFFFFFFMLFHLTHVFFSLRVLPIQWNVYQYKPTHWRGVMKTGSCLESLGPRYAFLSHFFLSNWCFLGWY